MSKNKLWPDHSAMKRITENFRRFAEGEDFQEEEAEPDGEEVVQAAVDFQKEHPDLIAKALRDPETIRKLEKFIAKTGIEEKLNEGEGWDTRDDEEKMEDTMGMLQAAGAGAALGFLTPAIVGVGAAAGVSGTAIVGGAALALLVAYITIKAGRDEDHDSEKRQAAQDIQDREDAAHWERKHARAAELRAKRKKGPPSAGLGTKIKKEMK